MVFTVVKKTTPPPSHQKKKKKKNTRKFIYLVCEPMFHFVTDSDIISGYRTNHLGIILKLKLQELERGEVIGNLITRF